MTLTADKGSSAGVGIGVSCAIRRTVSTKQSHVFRAIHLTLVREGSHESVCFVQCSLESATGQSKDLPLSPASAFIMYYSCLETVA
ncbi:unnamed protein product [Protopolystoma xenopodis]|uniref:Uncharacterized protein n=1 Tax=Protopolystoma xenopodis TaxID=117903 RepID=A0A3S5CMY3_9PLAT|nr:unnamed protein product [Protopolystoma xenopodis]